MPSKKENRQHQKMASQKVFSPQHEVARIARAMLDGSIHYLVGAMALEALRHDVGAYENDPDFMPFVAILSDIDQLPCDTESDGWVVAGMESCSSEIEASIKWAKEISITQCESLAQRYRE